MGKQEKYKENKLKKKVYKIFRYIFLAIYLSVTAVIPIYVFYYTYSSKNSIIYAAAFAFMFFIVMDVCCSIAEDIFGNIYVILERRKRKKQKEKEKREKKKKEEMQKIENILTEKHNYQPEIAYAESEFKEFRKYVEALSKKVPKQVRKSLEDISKKLQDIIDILHEDSEQYYSIRHMVKVYFPEFKKIAKRYEDIIITENDENTTSDFLKLVVEFQEYLESMINRIQDTDKVSFDVGIRALTKIIESERKKGEDNAKK